MLDFIVNPSAGGHSGAKIKKALNLIKERLKERDVDYVIHFTDKPHHATQLTASLIKGGATDIIAVGGDGTLHEVINGFDNFENVNMGIIPCGTGNDFATAIGLPLDPIKAVDLIINGKPQYTDFMQMKGVRGLNIIGTGIDVDVLKRYQSLKKKTKFKYTMCLIKTLFNFEYSDFEVEINGVKNSYRSFIACIANGNMYGGGIPVCPIADPTDNDLDFVAVKEISKLGLIGAFLKLKKGKILTFPQTHHEKMKSIKITTDKPVTINVDGELYDNIPFEVDIVSNKLKL
ncbi:MAG: diacylglycerol kinase family lipid kinase, partial [Clostridia bacterium]|nr:diacylglycerol kinase family lipid kinase [Clostridia bacterium]